MGNSTITDLDDLAARVPDGAQVVVPPDYSGVAMAATRALLRRGVRGLHLVAMPTSGLQADMLVGAGAVAMVEAASITMGEFGGAPCFVRALREGRIAMRDATCPALHSALQAGQKGAPFMPIRGLLG
ncbi:MAG: CoA synthetase, partial [Hyphomicrobiales bacterium]|nr:CoA synthetase [Hyphomicrobiales bacterium]